MAKKRLSKNQKRRLKKKTLKAQQKKDAEQKVETPDEVKKENEELAVAPVDVEVQYISSKLRNEVMTNDTLAQFRDVFEKFTSPEELTAIKVHTTTASIFTRFIALIRLRWSV